ncbi:MAG: hypothetical protein CMJ74_08455 [Planctomycetaceae bacterium]|nr:hypothetical protein [Planctomycetaceae bacterium]
MNDLILFSSAIRVWYVIPLVICISMVYAATHHEQMSLIIRRAIRTSCWILGFMFFAFCVLSVIQILG